MNRKPAIIALLGDFMFWVALAFSCAAPLAAAMGAMKADLAGGLLSLVSIAGVFQLAQVIASHRADASTGHGESHPRGRPISARRVPP